MYQNCSVSTITILKKNGLSLFLKIHSYISLHCKRNEVKRPAFLLNSDILPHLCAIKWSGRGKWSSEHLTALLTAFVLPKQTTLHFYLCTGNSPVQIVTNDPSSLKYLNMYLSIFWMCRIKQKLKLKHMLKYFAKLELYCSHKLQLEGKQLFYKLLWNCSKSLSQKSE